MDHLTSPVGQLDHTRGPADAPVTLVEYGDFQCPYCGEMYGVIKSVQEALGEQLRFVFRHFPLTDLHEHALHAAQFAEAASVAGQFWQAHDVLFENQTELADAELQRYGAELGLHSRDLAAAFEGKYDDVIQGDFEGGLRSGVNGTPTLFINGGRYDGDRDAATIASALRAAIREA